ncbi:D-alanyl-D-alanine carboxypeptidase family protein [Aquamicrobium segne]|uniref:D-alanyl-D-alanine carboxypeptidase family protein n=1 Tax=Aquamicrobium segne TaxID=469547 RepID=A0ABW0GT73_9HYPH
MTTRRFVKLALSSAIGLGALSATASANPTLLFELNTGKVLAHEDAFKRWYPASLTKMMTAYVAFRAIEAGEAALDSPIRMTRNAAKQPPSKMGFKTGQIMRLDNALKMMMIKSANDVAMAIGENIGGTQADFAARMNAEAARLGMSGTHFVNPNGLFSPDQYTTARDMALLVSAIRRDFPQYNDWYTIEGLLFGKTQIPNFNLLVGRYPGADGMKTGFVCESGFNLVGTATRNGRTLAAVVFGETNGVTRAEAVAKLLDAGFATQGQGSATIASLVPYGDMQTPTNLRPVICKPADAASQSEASTGPKNAQKSIYQQKLTNPRLVTVDLGGATGPVPKAMIGRVEYADVPVPGWRPDLPPPVFANASQGG